MEIPDDLRDLSRIRDYLKNFTSSVRKKFTEEALNKNRGLSDNYPRIEDVDKFKKWAKQKFKTKEASRFIELSQNGVPLEENVRRIVYVYVCENGYRNIGLRKRESSSLFSASLDEEASSIVNKYSKDKLLSKSDAIVELIKIAATFHE